MIITPQSFRIKEKKIVFNKVFVPGQSSWEIVDNETERTFIKNNHYYMENFTNSSWNFYKNRMPKETGECWMIETQIEFLGKDRYGQCGIVWGFDESNEMLNRFTISADGKRGVVMQFQKDHVRVPHRFPIHFSTPFDLALIDLSIIKMNRYFYFLINKELIYICEQSHFAESGNYFGYYIEPDLFVRSPYMIVSKLTIEERSGERFERLFI